MNVYEIGEYIIAAENTDQALGTYVEETNELESLFIEDIDEGEETNVVINIRRLKTSEIAAKQIECCEDGCELCSENNAPVYLSYQDLIDKRPAHAFPCVIAEDK